MTEGSRIALVQRVTSTVTVMLVFFVGLLAACRTHPRPQSDEAPPATGDCRAVGCNADQYCKSSRGLCGKGTSASVCRPKPSHCPRAYAPVCGCDGRAYDNECEASRAGVDLAATGGCHQPIVDYAPCGPRFCDTRATYCEIYLSDVLELPTTYRCRPLPAGCLPVGGVRRSCSCFPSGTPCLSFCGPLASGGLETFHLTCQGVKDPEG